MDTGLKQVIEGVAFNYTRRVLKGKIGVVFYDMTTLYFEASEEEDYRVIGFSKDGKHQQPQIMIGLLVSSQGYPIGYRIFEGNTAEAKTLIPVLEAFQERFNFVKPIIIADASLLSQKNIAVLEENNYEYILGGRLKNENNKIKDKILNLDIEEGAPQELIAPTGRLIITYSS